MCCLYVPRVGYLPQVPTYIYIRISIYICIYVLSIYIYIYIPIYIYIYIGIYMYVCIYIYIYIYICIRQVPWVKNGSVLDNITLRSVVMEERGGEGGGHTNGPALLDHVLEACDLFRDIEQWPKGLQTEVGERGIQLSGIRSLLAVY